MIFDPTLNFTTKQQYLVWRLRWKEQFFYLIDEARKAKVEVKEAMRAYSKDSKRIGDIWTAYANRRTTVQDIDKHLHVLWRAKEEARRQVLARLAAR